MQAINEYSERISLFPNPAQDRLYIQSDIVPEQVELSDVYGKILPAIYKAGEGMDIGILAPGIYMVKMDQ